MKNRAILISLLILELQAISMAGFAQAPDESDPTDIEEAYMNDQETEDGNISQDLFTETLVEFNLRPVNINSEEISELLQAGLITEKQFQTLTDYRYRYGAMMTVYELLYADGWDERSLRRILPYIRIGSLEEGRNDWKDLLNRTEQNVVISSAYKLQKSKGYRESADEGQGSHYSGSPLKLAFRYDFNSAGRFRAGLRAEKDPGEQMLNPVNSSDQCRLPDHLSGYIQLKNISCLKTLCAGDYLLNFGQGLMLGYGTFRNQGMAGLIKAVDGIRAHTSMNERYYFRGAGLTTGLRNFSLTVFYSVRKLDPSGITLDTNGNQILSYTGISATGYHRTANEIAWKNSLKETIAGAFAVYGGKWLKAGLGGMLPRFSHPQEVRTETYARFAFLDRKVFYLSGELQLMFRRTHFASECTYRPGSSPSWIVKIVSQPSDGLKAGLVYRHLPSDFHNPYGSGFVSFSRNNNDSGWWMGWEIELPSRTVLNFDVDLSRSAWISFKSDASARRCRIAASLTRRISPLASLFISCSYRNVSATDRDDYQYTEKIAFMESLGFRCQVSCQPTEWMEVKAGIYYNCFSTSIPVNSEGSAVFFDFRFKPSEFPLKCWFRTGLFGTGSYDSRIYLYENGPLYGFNSVSVYGNGWRTACMLTWSPLPWLDAWMKVGQSTFPGQLTIGSGLEESEGPRKTILEAQVRVKW